MMTHNKSSVGVVASMLRTLSLRMYLEGHISLTSRNFIPLMDTLKQLAHGNTHTDVRRELHTTLGLMLSDDDFSNDVGSLELFADLCEKLHESLKTAHMEPEVK